MQMLTPEGLTLAVKDHRSSFRDGFFLLTFMILFYLIAYEYDIFPNAPGVPPQEVELDEALALIALLYAGLCVLILQRAPLPIAAEVGVNHNAIGVPKAPRPVVAMILISVSVMTTLAWTATVAWSAKSLISGFIMLLATGLF